MSLVLLSRVTVLRISPPFCEVSTAWNLITLIMSSATVWPKFLVVLSCVVESLVWSFIIRTVVIIPLVSHVTISLISLLEVYFVSLVGFSGIRVLILSG